MGYVKYGYVFGVRSMIPVVIGDSEEWKDLSGCFAAFEETVDTLGRTQIVPAATSASLLAGWVDLSEYTSGATAGMDEAMMDISPLSIYRVPVSSGTLGLGDVGDYCDLVRDGSSYIQGINAASGTQGVLIIVQRESASIALVRMNPSKMTGIEAAAA